MHRIFQLKLLGEFGEIVGVGVHVVAAPRLTRSTVTSTVVRDTSIPARRQEEHLIFKRIRGQRPAVAEYHGLPATPILVIKLRAVFGRNRAHRVCSFGVQDRRMRLFGRCGRRRR